jgi:hypothetical protein
VTMLPMRTTSADDFQTPSSALAPLLPYLQKVWKVWEPAMGEGRLVAGLREQGYQVEGSDIKTGDDFLLSERDCGVIVTNPPYSRKQEFLERCYALGKPFALLLPLTALETEERQQLFRKHGIEIILLSKRITFETPHKRKSSPWFATAWFTHGLNIGQQLTFSRSDMKNRKRAQAHPQTGKHYWLSPRWLWRRVKKILGVKSREEIFDPCPFPRPEGFNGLVTEWGNKVYVNPLFIPVHEVMPDGKTKKIGITAWVRKAIKERDKGKDIVIGYPVDGWLHLLLGAGVETYSLGDVFWESIEDGSTNQCSRPIMVFFLRGKKKRE